MHFGATPWRPGRARAGARACGGPGVWRQRDGANRAGGPAKAYDAWDSVPREHRAVSVVPAQAPTRDLTHPNALGTALAPPPCCAPSDRTTPRDAAGGRHVKRAGCAAASTGQICAAVVALCFGCSQSPRRRGPVTPSHRLRCCCRRRLHQHRRQHSRRRNRRQVRCRRALRGRRRRHLPARHQSHPRHLRRRHHRHGRLQARRRPARRRGLQTCCVLIQMCVVAA